MADSTLVDLDEVTNEVVEARWVFDKPEGHVTPEWESAMGNLRNLLYRCDYDFLTEGDAVHPILAFGRSWKGIEIPPTIDIGPYDQKFADSFFEKDSPVREKTLHDYSLLANAVIKEATPSFLMRIAKMVLLDDKYAEKGRAIFKSDMAPHNWTVSVNPWLSGFTNLYDLVYHGESKWICPIGRWGIGEDYGFTPDPFDSVIPAPRSSRKERLDWKLGRSPVESVEWMRKTGLGYQMPYAHQLLNVLDEHELHGVRAAILRDLKPITLDLEASFNILHLVMAYNRVFNGAMPVEMWQHITRLSNTSRPDKYGDACGGKTAWKEYPTLKKSPQLALKSKLVYV